MNLSNSEHLRSDFKSYKCTELSLIYSGVRYEVRLRLRDLFKASQLILVHSQVWEPPWYEREKERERLPQWLRCKTSACNVGDPGSIPGFGRSLWRRKWQPTPVPLPGKSHGERSLVGCSPWGPKELDTTEWLHFHFSGMRTQRGNPLIFQEKRRSGKTSQRR